MVSDGTKTFSLSGQIAFRSYHLIIISSLLQFVCEHAHRIPDIAFLDDAGDSVDGDDDDDDDGDDDGDDDDDGEPDEEVSHMLSHQLVDSPCQQLLIDLLVVQHLIHIDGQLC